MNFFKLNLDSTMPQAGTAGMSQSQDLSLQTRAIHVINIFRLTLSLTFLFFSHYAGEENWLDHKNTPLFFELAIAYTVFSITLLSLSQLKLATLVRMLPLQIIIDIVFITLFMHATGGSQNGLGLLLIIVIVTAGLVSDGRLALFYAAIASIGLLLEQSYQIIQWNALPWSYTQPVMLSLSCFATAWLAHSLAKRMQRSEALASARGIDLENMAQVNALITQEMHDGVLVIDQSFNIRHHNLQAESLLSLQKNNDDNITLASSTPEIAIALNHWLENRDARTIISIDNRELKLRFKPIYQLNNSVEPNNNLNEKLDFQSNHYVGVVIFIQDLSQSQAAAQQAKLAALGRLTANIAHEIRNPLSAISHANQLLQEDETSASTARMLNIVADNIQRIDQIIKDVLELNRRDRTQQERIELGQFLIDFYTQFSAVEKLPTSHFHLELPAQKHTIYFDPRHLTQILWNLCKNGWQHSKQQVGSLSLRCVESGKLGINIEVKDDGNGVAEQDRSRLFEPFFTTKTTGNGLGLYISRELAEANGTSLQYEVVSTGNYAFVIHLKKTL